MERATVPNGKLGVEETNVDVVFKNLNDIEMEIEGRMLLPNTQALLQLTLDKCLTTTTTLVFSSFSFSMPSGNTRTNTYTALET